MTVECDTSDERLSAVSRTLRARVGASGRHGTGWSVLCVCILAVVAALGFGTGTAQAFMTWETPGSSEHERITRAAVACNSVFARLPADDVDWSKLCIHSLAFDGSAPAGTWQLQATINNLAGGGGSSLFGGVGAPDRKAEVVSSNPASHCDEGDWWFLSTPWYGSTYPGSLDARTQKIYNCMVLLQAYMKHAVQQAGNLVVGSDAKGWNFNIDQIELANDCYESYDLATNVTAGGVLPDGIVPSNGTVQYGGQSKCAVLISVGRAMHIAEDFYAHSNWTDENPSTPDASTPPGLQNPVDLIPEGLRYPRTPSSIDAWLDSNQVITGFYPGSPSDPAVATDRIYHNHALTKDSGMAAIDWTSDVLPAGNGAGKFRRGAAGSLDGQDNFQRAARGAIYAASTLWADFYRAIVATYPGDRGTKIWTAITQDAPWTQCAVTGSSTSLLDGTSHLNTPTNSGSSLTIFIENTSAGDLSCDRLALSSGSLTSPFVGGTLKTGGLSAGGFKTVSVDDGMGYGGQGSGAVSWGNGAVVVTWFTNAGDPSVSCSAVAGLTCTVTKRDSKYINVSIAGTARRGRAKGGLKIPSRYLRPLPPQKAKRLNGEIVLKSHNLSKEIGGLRTCPHNHGYENLHLDVEDITCKRAVHLLLSAEHAHTDNAGVERYCPYGWKLVRFPKGIKVEQGSVFCLQHRGAEGVDRTTRGIMYTLPHALGMKRG